MLDAPTFLEIKIIFKKSFVIGAKFSLVPTLHPVSEPKHILNPYRFKGMTLIRFKGMTLNRNDYVFGTMFDHKMSRVRLGNWGIKVLQNSSLCVFKDLLLFQHRLCSLLKKYEGIMLQKARRDTIKNIVRKH